ncbi:MULTISPECIES: hypothetical protein [unclassified Mesorhizobium]|uniref:hypothetical protein n=1 Tax=unclassified Mesorhizobium TaxID=325217 RepID=UPI0003CE3339|nr:MULTISPECIES: hypothetical protein [unclassified Mesorhizobium]ESY22382.1 hypothetical protein X751_05620 [Mesorhizobium sp. LNJC395A00]WJI72876.1 hypothetical protein NLY37_17725 [Mesorhizobium sp. C395A]
MDGYVTAARHAFLAIVLATAAFLYLSIGEIHRNQDQVKKSSVSMLIALKDIGLGVYKTRKATSEDLHKFSPQLGEQYSELYNAIINYRFTPEDNGRSDKAIEEMDRRFGTREAGVGEVVENIPMPYSATRRCDALLIQPDDYFFVWSYAPLYFGNWSEIYSRSIRYVIFDNDCQYGTGDRFYALIFPGGKDLVSFGVRGSDLSVFPSIEPWSSDPKLNMDRADQDRMIPPRIRKYFPNDKGLFVIDSRAVELLSADLLSSMDGKFYSTKDLSASIINIYDQDRQKTSLGGINLSSRDFLRAVPLWLVAVSYYLWRQLRRLAGHSLFGKVWTPIDTADLPGVIVAYAWALMPFACTAIVYALYPSVFQLSLVVFGRAITPYGILTGDFPVVTSGDDDYLAWLTFFALFLHFLLVGLCARAAFVMIERNRIFRFSRVRWLGGLWRRTHNAGHTTPAAG